MTPSYNEDSIKSLEWNEHIRMRPGMYIGKLGDGTSYDDGIYVLIKEIIESRQHNNIFSKGDLLADAVGASLGV